MLESFVYQYAVEGLIFGVGIYCGIRAGVLSPKTPNGTRRLVLLGGGMLFVFALQGAFLVWGK